MMNSSDYKARYTLMITDICYSIRMQYAKQFGVAGLWHQLSSGGDPCGVKSQLTRGAWAVTVK